MPAAGAPFAISRTWVEMRAMLSPQREAETAEGRPSVGVHAGGVAVLDHSIPGAIVCFEIDFGDSGDILQHLRPDAMDDLLNAARFEAVEYLMHQSADLLRDR